MSIQAIKQILEPGQALAIREIEKRLENAIADARLELRYDVGIGAELTHRILADTTDRAMPPAHR